jgi:hypothetical protein
MTGRAAVARWPGRLPAIHGSFPSRLRRALWGIRTTGIRCEPARPDRVPGRHITTKWRVLMGLCGAAGPRARASAMVSNSGHCPPAVRQPNIHNCEYRYGSCYYDMNADLMSLPAASGVLALVTRACTNPVRPENRPSPHRTALPSPDRQGASGLRGTSGGAARGDLGVDGPGQHARASTGTIPRTGGSSGSRSRRSRAWPGRCRRSRGRRASP